MSNIIISSNLFLETQEINNMIKFLSDDGYKRIVKSIVKSFGVVMPNINSDNFRVNENDTSSSVLLLTYCNSAPWGHCHKGIRHDSCFV